MGKPVFFVRFWIKPTVKPEKLRDSVQWGVNYSVTVKHLPL